MAGRFGYLALHREIISGYQGDFIFPCMYGKNGNIDSNFKHVSLLAT